MKLKFCGHCGNEKLTPERRMELRTRFDELHSKGAKAFGTDWLKGNEAATAAARANEIDVSDPRMRALLSETVYRVMKLFAEEIKK